MSIRVDSSGDFDKTRRFIDRVLKRDIFDKLDQYGRVGVDALAAATPVETGITSESWGYRVFNGRTRCGITWYNTNTVNGIPVVILIQYGHATRTGGYVEGRDFINPAIESVFEQIAADVWREVMS